MQVNIDLKIVATLLGIIVTLAGGIGGYYVMRAEVATLKTDVAENSKHIDDLKFKAATDGAVLKDVKDDVQEIKKDVKDLLTR